MALGNTQSGRSNLSAFTKALVSYAEAIGDADALETERDALFDKLTSGADGKSIIASTINGKYFGYQITLTLEEKFQCFVNAVKIFNGAAGDSPVTFIDFSWM